MTAESPTLTRWAWPDFFCLVWRLTDWRQDASNSESVDPALLNKGFDDTTDDDEHLAVRQLDDETQESEDWAERDLRELRTHVAAPTPGRR